MANHNGNNCATCVACFNKKELCSFCSKILPVVATALSCYHKTDNAWSPSTHVRDRAVMEQ